MNYDELNQIRTLKLKRKHNLKFSMYEKLQELLKSEDFRINGVAATDWEFGYLLGQSHRPRSIRLYVSNSKRFSVILCPYINRFEKPVATLTKGEILAMKGARA